MFNSPPAPATNISGDLIRFKAKVNNDYSFLSNFYPHVKNFSDHQPQPAKKGVLLTADDLSFAGVEVYYQYQKYLIIDPQYASAMLEPSKCHTSIEAKQRGAKGFYIDYVYKNTPMRRGRTKAAIKAHHEAGQQEFIKEHALSVMRKGLYCKFSQNPELKKALLNSKQRPLSELGRMKRDFWGHTGQDMLGRLLMELREQLQTGLPR
jgi:predicted NAD-dependent protein-ADP-ribosyltransferase YbiA (DUF1768 family)